MDALGTRFHYAVSMAVARTTLGLQVRPVGRYARPSPALLAPARGGCPEHGGEVLRRH